MSFAAGNFVARWGLDPPKNRVGLWLSPDSSINLSGLGWPPISLEVSQAFAHVVCVAGNSPLSLLRLVNAEMLEDLLVGGWVV